MAYSNVIAHADKPATYTTKRDVPRSLSTRSASTTCTCTKGIPDCQWLVATAVSRQAIPPV